MKSLDLPRTLRALWRYRLFYPLAARFPQRWAYKWATLQGMADHWFDGGLYRAAQSHLQQALLCHDLEAGSIARAMQRMQAREIMDVYRLPRLTAQNIGELITLEGIDHYQSALATGRPIMLYSAHFGRLIMPAIALGLMGYPTSALTQPVDNNAPLPAVERRYLQEKIRRMQTIMRGEFVSTAQSLRRLYALLEARQTLIVLIDVPPVPGQAFYETPLLGGIAKFPRGIVKLAWQTGAVLVPYFTREENRRLIGEFLPPLHLGAQETPESLLAKIVAPLASQITRRPDQWWMWPWLRAFWRHE